MIRIENNGEYIADRQRMGASTRGEWELISVRAEKGKQEITIFPDNKPTGILEGDRFRIKNIRSVTVKATKNQKGEWGKDAVQVEATCEKIKAFAGYESYSGDDGLDL